MAKRIEQQKTIVGGISDSLKSNQAGTFAFGSALDFRSNPFEWTINPRTEKQAGSLITDLPMWADLACSNLYFYGNTGNIYLKDANDNWTVDHLAPNSSGNGMAFFPEDEYLYYAQSKTIGRKSRACANDGVYYDGFLESEGGEPTNTQSITFVKNSSQYASVADNASLSITDDISMETYIKFASLPASGEVQTLISKWNEQGNQRSYKFDLTTSSSFFGDGRDGALTVSGNITDDPIDANGSGTVGSYTMTTRNEHASFSSLAQGDKVLIHQSRGDNAGTKQIATVQSFSGNTLTLQEALTATFLDSSGDIISGNAFNQTNTVPANVATNIANRNKTQIIKLKQYTNVTVNSGITWTAKAWDGNKGGILGFFANGTFTNNGTITGKGKGFRGGQGFNLGNFPAQGEGSSGWIYAGLTSENYTDAALPNGNGGGATRAGSGASGGNGTAGTNGVINSNNSNRTKVQGIAGTASGVPDLSMSTFGGAAAGSDGNNSQTGARGGGMAEIYAYTTSNTSTGTINFNGNDGSGIQGWDDDGGSGGAGGSVNFKAYTFTNTGTITATGGVGGQKSGNAFRVNGVAGANGRVAVAYGSTATGASTPTATLTYDPTINNVDGYILRLLISSNGTNIDTYTQNVTSIIETDKWYRWAVTWDAPTSTANFYQNAVLLGTQRGTLTQIYNSTARFAIAASYNSSGAASQFLDAKMDDTRVWNSVRSQLELAYYNDRVLAGTEQNNSAYYKFEGNLNDSQSYTFPSNLTQTNNPTYSTDVPFAGITARVDQDININAVGSTYALGTVLSEAAADRQTFQPTKEPVKSVQLNINAKGTGDWTVVIHDALNRELASITVPNAQLSNGYYEFIFSESFRPILTANYHVHVYSTVADGSIVSSTLNDMEGTTGNTGAYFATFFQILVDDVYHPMMQYQNFMVIGNERYVAKLEAGNLYNPHQLTLPAGYRVRCFAKWNEYLAIGVWKGNSITDTDQGKIFLWDGNSDTTGTSSANTIIDVLEGGVNAMQGAAGILYVISGYEGKLSMYGGGVTEKVTQVPLLERNEYTEVAPGAMTMWRSLLRFGSSLNTDSENTHKGIYGYGRLNANYPNSLGFDFPLSVGDQTSSATRIGCLFPAGQSLYAGWQNGNVFGIDKVSVTNDCYTTARLESCIYDAKRMTQKKLPLTYRVDFEPLTQGQSISVYERRNRETSWNILETEDTVGATELRATPHGQINEIQYAVVVESTSGISPVIIQNALELDDQGESIAA